MGFLNETITILAATQLILLSGTFLLHYRGELAVWITLFCICLVAYILIGLPPVSSNTWLSYFLFRLATLSPYLLWIIAFQLFVDDRAIPVSLIIIIVAGITTRALGIGIAILEPQILANNIFYTIIHVIPQGLMLSFTIHSVYLAIMGYNSDLLEQRRRVRLFFVFFMGVLCTFVLGIDFINLLGRFTAYTISIGLPKIAVLTYLFGTAFALNLALLRARGQTTTDLDLDSPDQHSAIGPNGRRSEDTLLLIDKIKQQIAKDRMYSQPGLTIRDLAAAVSVQEYKVRRVINRELGYKNFSQFLNNYRIQEASERISKSTLPISSIALDVGYSSLSVFNRAFRERFGTTPSQFRTQKKHAGNFA